MPNILICDDEKDIVNALKIYLNDPLLTLLEVAARVSSQLRRYLQLSGGTAKPVTYRIGGIELDDAAKTVSADGEPVALTPKEYQILKLLMAEPGRVFSPKEIYQTV